MRLTRLAAAIRVVFLVSVTATFGPFSAPAAAQDVRITPEISTFDLTLNGMPIRIERNQDSEHRLTGDFTKTSRPCPPFCIQPVSVAPGVATVAELEVMEFLKTSVADGKGLLVDSRLPDWFRKGTIPGAVNVPFPALEATNPYRDEILKALGARPTGETWDFSQALDLTLFCNGPWCDQSPHAIRSLLQAGYPPEKLSHYRGGMQSWLLLGLSVYHPTS